MNGSRSFRIDATFRRILHPFLLCGLLVPACGGPSAPISEVSAPVLVVDEPSPRDKPPKRANPGWWRRAVFYEIFVRSFADSDGDGVGDFNGLTQRLDVLNDGDPSTTDDLGVDALWLMPIHASPSDHGYDAIDYRSVNPDYGTDADFDALLAAAKARGIRVIIDFVLNHSSDRHPWFQSAAGGPDSPYRDFYVWRGDDPGWTQPWGGDPVWHRRGEANASAYYYGIFWSGMPDLNLGNPKVEAEMIDAMRFWLDRGVAGFRVDAARHFFESADGQLNDQPESHAFVKRIRAALAPDHPDVLLIGEIWTDHGTVATYFGEGDEFHLAFGFDTATAIVTAARDGLRATFEQTLRSAHETYVDWNFEAPFLTNHDMNRIMRQLDGDAGAMRVAASALFAVPGTPFVYYGEEIGMRGGPSSHDEDKRTPMRWTPAGPGYGFTTAAKSWHTAAETSGTDLESQRGVPSSLWTLYRDLIALRGKSPALLDGDTVLPARSGGGRGATALLRTLGDERVLYVANFHTEPTDSPFEIAVDGAPRLLFGEGVTAAPTSTGGKIVFPKLAARAFAYVALD